MRTRSLWPASILVVRVLAVAAIAPARAQQPAPATLRADLDRKLEVQMDRIAERLEGVLGYAVKDFSTGDSFYRNADLVFPTASSIKLTVLLELMRQDQDHKLSLDEKHTVRRNETPAGDTEPILHFLGDGTVTMTLRDLAIFMVVLSDNSATNILIDRLGMDNISAEIARLGLTQTHLRRHMIDIEAARRGYENVSTPCELMALLEKVRGGGALDAAHTKDYFDLLALPKASPFNKALPATVRIEDKPGALDAVRCDAGIIELTGHPFAMSVMTAYLRSNDEGERAIQEIARLTYEHFNRLSRSSAYGRVISEKNW